jgi:hypothetical protein
MRGGTLYRRTGAATTMHPFDRRRLSDAGDDLHHRNEVLAVAATARIVRDREGYNVTSHL